MTDEYDIANDFIELSKSLLKDTKICHKMLSYNEELQEEIIDMLAESIRLANNGFMKSLSHNLENIKEIIQEYIENDEQECYCKNCMRDDDNEWRKKIWITTRVYRLL